LRFKLHIILYSLTLLIALSACSTKKKGFANRAFHNTVARYNGYFNAKEILKEELTTFRKNKVEDYDSLLSVFLTPTLEEATSMFPAMDKIIEKCSKVISRNSMDIRGTEYCKWIDDNYLMIGKANYYKHEYTDATKIFDFVAKEYNENEEMRPKALFWLVKNHVDNGKLTDAQLILNILNREELENLSKENLKNRSLINAHYNIARKKYIDAAENLVEALPFVKKKWEKQRLYFLTAQLYSKAEKSNEALKYFQIVAKKSNNYDLAFSAKIAQASAVSGRANSLSVKQELLKMLKDDKNLEYQDQIYYALGNISFTEKKYTEGVEYFTKSTIASIDNPKQKSKSFLKLGNYYFEEKNYEDAQANYDSAVYILPEKYPDYLKIKKLSDDLGELVLELNIVNLNDSLLTLSELEPSELNRRLKNVIRDLEKEEEEKAKNITFVPTNTKSKPATSKGSWYFYNESTKTFGAQQFLKTWGSRPLEDNWRRSSKNIAFSGTKEETPDATTTVSASSIPSLSDLKQSIPKTEPEKTQLRGELMEALYNSGILYKEKFQDYDNSIEAFENLVARFDTTKYKLVAYYQLYRMYLQKENQQKTDFFSFDSKSSSFYYKDLILYEYPNSEFAALIKNPLYASNAAVNSKESEERYREIFGLFKSSYLDSALAILEVEVPKQINGDLGPQYTFLKGMVLAQQMNLGEYIATLKLIQSQFPKTDQGKEATRILAFLDQKVPKSEVGSSTISNDPIEPSIKSEATESDSPYVDSKDEEHYYIILCPIKDVEANKVKIEYSNFNSKYFSSQGLSINGTYLDNKNQLILVKKFSSGSEMLVYNAALEQNIGELTSTKNKKLGHFGISRSNFVTLFKTKKVAEYVSFFKENYLN